MPVNCRIIALALTLGAILVTGCSENVTTRLRLDQPFSIYGLINPKADTHGVRVFEIQHNIMLVRPEPIDATVTSTLVQTGEKQLWRDSVIQLDDGDYRHVFWAAFRAATGETYHLKVVRSDGETSSATTTIPGPIELEVLEADTLKPGQALMPVFVHGDPPAVPRIDVEYVVVGFSEGGSDPIFKSVVFNYVGRLEQRPGGLLLEIDMVDDFLAIFEEFDSDNVVTTEVIDLREIILRIHVGDANWVSPIGVFDEEFLVEPGSFSNVENGFGYFGSAYVDSIAFRPPLALIRRAGFYVVGDE